MSVTILDLLKAPSLNSAQVIAGAAGLGRVVSSISVLECMDVDLLNDGLFKNDDSCGGEIVITSFVNVKDNVEVQCNVVRRLSEGGEVGVILFYVGVFLDKVDQRLLDLCEELEFPLICMPEGQMDCRYSEVIKDVMTIIIRDQAEDAYSAGEMLEQIMTIPEQGQGSAGMEELVKAILNDEPIKMRRLAEIFHINTGAIDHMIMIMSGQTTDGVLDEEMQQRLRQEVEEILKQHYEIRLFGSYQGNFLAFTGNENVRETSRMILNYLYQQIKDMSEDLILLSCPGLESTTDVRESFLQCREFVHQSRIIYPQNQVITLRMVQFARSCQEILDRGEEVVLKTIQPLRRLESDQPGELRKTLETYLLDADMNIAKTAELLFVHKNTIKYRVANLNRMFHCQINKMPEAFELYQAAAVSRLLQTLPRCPDGQTAEAKVLPKV